MKCAINMDKMTVTHVHRILDILHGLVSLECRNIRTMRFEDTENPLFLATLSRVQLGSLFRNTTGEMRTGEPEELRAAIAVAVNNMKPMLVDDNELMKQIGKVAKQLEGRIGQVPNFKYALGKSEPLVGDYPAAKTVANSDVTAQRTAAAQQQLKPLPPTPTPATYAPRAQREKTGDSAPAPRAPTPPRGGVGGIVWDIADKMWAAAGKPMDQKVVLNLRKEMMNVLEKDHEVKRSVASNTLGQWMKARLTEK